MQGILARITISCLAILAYFLGIAYLLMQRLSIFFVSPFLQIGVFRFIRQKVQSFGCLLFYYTPNAETTYPRASDLRSAELSGVYLKYKTRQRTIRPVSAVVLCSTGVILSDVALLHITIESSTARTIRNRLRQKQTFKVQISYL